VKGLILFWYRKGKRNQFQLPQNAVILDTEWCIFHHG